MRVPGEVARQFEWTFTSDDEIEMMAYRIMRGKDLPTTRSEWHRMVADIVWAHGIKIYRTGGWARVVVDGAFVSWAQIVEAREAARKVLVEIGVFEEPPPPAESAAESPAATEQTD